MLILFKIKSATRLDCKMQSKHVGLL